MPIRAGASRATIEREIHHLVHDRGYSPSRAVAAALHQAHYRRRHRNPVAAGGGSAGLLLVLVGGFILYKSGALNSLLGTGGGPAAPSRGALPSPFAGGSSGLPSPSGPQVAQGGATVGFTIAPPPPAQATPTLVSPGPQVGGSSAGPSAALTAMGVANPNIAQQMAQWQYQVAGSGRAPCDWGEFRAHVIGIGAPDPGGNPPPEFTAACGTVLGRWSSQIDQVQRAVQSMVSAYDGFWRIQIGGQTLWALLSGNPAVQALAHASTALRGAVDTISTTGDVATVGARITAFGQAADGIWRIQPFGDGRTVYGMTQSDPVVMAIGQAWAALQAAYANLQGASRGTQL